MVTIEGKLVSIGAVSGGEQSAEIQLDNGHIVDVRGLTLPQIRELCHHLYESVRVEITAPGKSGE